MKPPAVCGLRRENGRDGIALLYWHATKSAPHAGVLETKVNSDGRFSLKYGPGDQPGPETAETRLVIYR